MTGSKRRVGLMLALISALGVLLRLREEPARYDLPDDLELVSAVRVLAGHHTHGQQDNGSPVHVDAVAAKRPLVATCGYVSPWAVRVLEEEGFEARVVETLTLDEWNGTNNGHVMVEARLDGRWVLFDIDRDVWFWRDGRPMSLIELIDAVPSGAYEIRPLSGDPVEPDSAMRPDNERLLQVPMIRDGAAVWFYSTDPDRVRSYAEGYRVLGEQEWRARFYA